MPKGYFTSVVSSFLFWRLISEVIERISIKLGYIFTYDCYDQAFTSHRLGAKNRFWGLTLKFDPNPLYLCNRIYYQQLKEICQCTGTHLHALKFGELWSRNGWELLASFCPPPLFSHWETASHTAWTLYNRQQANFSTCYVVAGAYNIEQQNAGLAQAELCHASSSVGTW